MTKKEKADELVIANKAILQSEKNFRRSISESPIGIRIVSIDSKIIYANKAFLDIYGFNSLKEFKSTPAINRHTPKSYAQHQERKEKRKNGHDVLDYEISIVSKNEGIRHVKVSRREVLWNGIKHYQVINIDITEQKKQTIDLIAAKEHAEQSDRLKSSFLANMSHEIRTPMNGILGFSDLLKEPELTGDKQQRYIRIIEKSGARMLNIINDIVDISKIETGLMEVHLEESNINEQIEYIDTFFKPEVEGKGMKLFFKNSLPSKEAIINTDREKIYAILTNLVKNAIKYTNEGSIEFGYNLKMESPTKVLEFFIKDTGIGISKDRQEAIFERFIQADITDKMALHGAGLGLSISKAFVELLGGKIWVSSEKGKGSTFYFTIPYKSESYTKSDIPTFESDEGEKGQIKNLKVLIVEDDEVSDLLISTMLEKINNQVLHSETGVEAIETCRNNPDLDLVLMDIQMPEMNGYEATRKIREFNKDVVIIAQTAFGLTGDREKSLSAGCNEYITKPINKLEFDSLIQNAL
jgi:PAS domain S-box-containing protein